MTEGQLVQKVAPTARCDTDVAVRFSLRKKQRVRLTLDRRVSRTAPSPAYSFFFPFFLLIQRNQQQWGHGVKRQAR